jgi:hypothetical protein
MATHGTPGPACPHPAVPNPAVPPHDSLAAAPPPVGSPWAAQDYGCPLTAEQLAEQEAILAELLGEDPGDLPPLVDLPTVYLHDHNGPGGPGFSSGSALDTLGPGPTLAAAVDDALAGGLEGLSDDALAGVILAARRCESRSVAQLLAAVGELQRRRDATEDRHVIEHADTELALLLTFSRRAATSLFGLSDRMSKLPATTLALAEGRLHRAQAAVIADETAELDPDLSAAVEQLVIEDAPRLTTTGLQRRVRRAVLAADPAAARRRVDGAQRDARVERYGERSGGTAALAGRDLPTAAALAADQRINAAALDLKAAGVPGSLPQLRAAVFLGFLNDTDPRTFLPSSGEDSVDDAPAQPGTARQPAPVAPPASGAPLAPVAPPASGGRPVPAPGLGVRGTVNLTLPLSTWIGATLSPGDITGLGPAAAETSQQLADWIAASPGSRWCLTLTDARGRAIGHGCARRPPPPPADTGRLAEWLARLKLGPIQAGQCTHARYSPGYRIPDSLHHIVKIRQQTCSNPICAQPAVQSDDDHTLAHDKGGITCECDLGPACRRCHRAKQANGWRLEQPRPGEFVWQPPHGRRYPSSPDTYPI